MEGGGRLDEVVARVDVLHLNWRVDRVLQAAQQLRRSHPLRRLAWSVGR